jgi:hypothetical protein
MVMSITHGEEGSDVMLASSSIGGGVLNSVTGKSSVSQTHIQKKRHMHSYDNAAVIGKR